jgi:molybdenum-dependent DNA-binding transcriptional regulator ModE
MRLIIEARIVDEVSSGKPVVLAEFGRKTGGMLDGTRIGMTLQEGHKLLKAAQQVFAQSYVENWLRQRCVCDESDRKSGVGSGEGA